MDLSGLSNLVTALIGIAAGGMILAGIYLIAKGGNIAKAIGLFVAALFVVGTYAVIIGFESIGPAVAGLFT